MPFSVEISTSLIAKKYEKNKTKFIKWKTEFQNYYKRQGRHSYILKDQLRLLMRELSDKRFLGQKITFLWR